MEENINTQEYWDKVYSTEKDWRAYPVTIEMISNVVGTGNRIVEFGCGTGRLAEKLNAQNNSVVGIDISAEAVSLFNKRLYKAFDAAAYKCDVLKMKIVPQGSIAIATEFLEHFKDEEVGVVLEKIRSSAPKAIFCVPNDILGNDICAEHYQRFTKDTLKLQLGIFYKKVLVIEYLEEFREAGNYIHMPALMAVCFREDCFTEENKQ